MEIALATKRKLLFDQGTIARPVDDRIKGDQWDAYNVLVIAWIVNSMFDSIAELSCI